MAFLCVFFLICQQLHLLQQLSSVCSGLWKCSSEEVLRMPVTVCYKVYPSRPFPLVLSLGLLLWVGCVRTQALHLHAAQARCSDFLQKILVWPGPGVRCPYLCGSLHWWEMFSWPGLFLPMHWVWHLRFCLLGIFIPVTSVKCS